MKQKAFKIAACALAGTITFTAFNYKSSATGVSSVLPVAGLALVLEEGNSVTEMKLADSVNTAAIKQAVNTQDVTIDDVLDTTIPATNPITKVEEETTVNAGEEVKTPSDEIVIPEADSQEADSQEADSQEADSQEADSQADTSVSENTVVEETTVSENAVEELTEEEKGFRSLVIADVDDYVNVRDSASEEGEIVGKLYDNSVGEFISEQDGWYEIQSGNCTGFVKSEYVVTGDDAIALAKEVGTRIATVTTTTLKVREQPGMDETVLGLVPIEDELTVLEELDGWVKVSIEEGEGYVSNEYVSLSTEFVKAESKEEEEARLAKEKAEREAANAAAAKAIAAQKKSASGNKSSSSSPAAVVSGGGSGTGTSVASFATQFVGNPYVYGGTSLTNGTDCSGFVMSVYNNYGVSLPHSSGALRSAGSDVGGLGNAQPGDIVCYSGHVGIYIGNGNIVHASTAATGIKISNASYRNVLSVRRIF